MLASRIQAVGPLGSHRRPADVDELSAILDICPFVSLWGCVLLGVAYANHYRTQGPCPDFILAPWGWYSDRNPSRRVPFLLSLLVVFSSTVMIWRASFISLQIVGRILQGCAAAFVWITGLAMIADAVGPENVGQAVGWLSMAMMIGT